MSANNWSFPFFTDGALDATKTAGLFVLKKDGVAVSPAATFTNNGDGTYQVDLQPYGSGRYSIEYDSTAQGEVTNIYLVTDDNLTQQNLASSPVLGQVQISGTNLYVYTDGAGGTLLHSNQIVNDLTSGGTAVPLSAAQGVALKALINAISAAAADVTVADAGGYLSATNVEAALQEIMGIIGHSGFTLANIVDASKTLFQNIDRLDIALDQLKARSNIYKRNIFNNVTAFASDETDAADIAELQLKDKTAHVILYAPFYKHPDENKIIFAANVLFSTNSSTNGIDVSLYADNSLVGTVAWSGIDDAFETWIAEFDVSTLTNGELHKLDIRMTNSYSGTGLHHDVKEMTMDVYTQKIIIADKSGLIRVQ